MNRIRFLLATVLFILSSHLLVAQNSRNESQKLTLRITSRTEKPVSFVATIFFKTEKAQLNHMYQETPYEITVESNYVNAVIVKTSGKSDLIVDLIKQKVGDQPDLKASGSTIIVGTNNADKGLYYQHTF